jgi:hypothetical protein
MRKLITLAMLALAIPAAAIAADTPTQNARAEAACHAQRTALGTAVFNLTYVGKTNANRADAFGKCVSTAVKSAQANNASALSTCKTAQAADRAAFKTKYDSLGKCVSTTAAAANDATQAATIAAAKSCKTELAAGETAFRAKYSTTVSKSNAFGKCVSTKVNGTS